MCVSVCVCECCRADVVWRQPVAIAAARPFPGAPEERSRCISPQAFPVAHGRENSQAAPLGVTHTHTETEKLGLSGKKK